MPSRGAQRIAKLCENTKVARRSRAEVFSSMDPNGNNVLSLAEVQKFMKDVWPEFNRQRMLIRAHSAADGDGSGYITRNEFLKFLKYIVFFDNLYDKFVAIDSDSDHRLTEAEFVKGCELIGGSKIEDPGAAFKAMDRNSGGFVLFDEFSVWVARKLCVDDAGVDDEMYLDAHRGSAAAIASADGSKVRSGAWWKGRMKLMDMTKKNDPTAKKRRHELFTRIDVDHSKGISPQEVFNAVKSMWPEFDSMEAVKSAFHAADRSGDGTIQFKEVRILLQYLIFFDDAWELFKQMDTNADGKLSLKEFKKGIHLLNLKTAVSNPDTAYHTMNCDGGEGVELDEFAAWLAEHSGKKSDFLQDTRRVRDSQDASSDQSLAEFMDSLGLADYTSTLVEQDIKTVADLAMMESGDLREVGLTIGAARKVLNAVKA
eukprot:m.439150 g.439150  ORF g.439150 m.439150 type:complete len:428 (+) comp18342_c0_seq1:2273-3556(+)